MPPVESKVAAGSVTAAVAGVITWLLVSLVPAFRGGLPPDLAPFIPVFTAWVLSTAAAWAAPHTPRPPAPSVTGTGHPDAPGGTR